MGYCKVLLQLEMGGEGTLRWEDGPPPTFISKALSNILGVGDPPTSFKLPPSTFFLFISSSSFCCFANFAAVVMTDSSHSPPLTEPPVS